MSLKHGPTLAKKAHEERKQERADRKAADRAQRRATKRAERDRREPSAAASEPMTELPTASSQPPANTPTPRCAVCGLKAPRGVLLFDHVNWPDGPRWVHRSCVAGTTREAAIERARAHAKGTAS